jgi:hypothetical protein
MIEILNILFEKYDKIQSHNLKEDYYKYIIKSIIPFITVNQSRKKRCNSNKKKEVICQKRFDKIFINSITEY